MGGRLDRVCGITRHTTPALVLPSVLCALLVLASPTTGRSSLAALVGFIIFTVLRYLMRRSSRDNWPLRTDLAIQVGAVLLTGGLVWLLGPDEYRESGVYRHLFVPLAAALSLSLLAASVFVALMFRSLCKGNKYGQYLKVTELFESRGSPPDVGVGTILTSLLLALFRAPLALLIIPAIAALLATPAWLRPVTLAAFLICYFALFVAGLNERFGVMWIARQAVFFQSGALLISLIVIILAGLRLADVTYVTTVFDGAAWWTIGVTLAGAYVLSWWYDYWSNRLLLDEIIGMLDPKARGRAQIAYAINPGAKATSVPIDGRVLQVHGASRFLALNEATNPPSFHSHTIGHLVELLATTGGPGGKAVPPPAQVSGRMFNFHAVAALFFALLVGTGMLVLHSGVQLPEARLDQSTKPGLSLGTLLFDSDAARHDPTLIVVAASGGGTRAALYTAAVLEGIAKLGGLPNVVLGSGVSGGGAALAYFAANRPDIVGDKTGAWDGYFAAMKQPYIRDVVDRSSEWRMVSRGRLGILLAESFHRRWKLPENRSRLEDIRDFGLIFNTSLAGHFDRPGGDVRNGHKALQEIEPEFREHYTKSVLAGGRLLLTNLELPAALAGRPLEPGATHVLPVVLRSPTLRLEDAAALNANFPPVFSNAAIDVNNQTRYWVTDGGAVDNRGMEMLLYALRLSLDSRNNDNLPRLHVVVADASALSERYSQDRGVSSVSGAGSHFASHLNAELVSGIRKKYEKHPDRFKFSYVMMPDRLRESGSFGTHWMLQTSITVHHGSDVKTISGDDMIDVLRALHTPGADRNLSPDACAVFKWSREDQSHQQGWLELVRDLNGSDAPPTCSE